MQQWFCGLMALGLSLVFGIAGQGQGQPSYGFTMLDVPGSELHHCLSLGPAFGAGPGNSCSRGHEGVLQML